MLIRPAKFKCEAEARYHKAEDEAKVKKIVRPNSVRPMPEMPY